MMKLRLQVEVVATWLNVWLLLLLLLVILLWLSFVCSANVVTTSPYSCCGLKNVLDLCIGSMYWKGVSKLTVR